MGLEAQTHSHMSAPLNLRGKYILHFLYSTSFRQSDECSHIKDASFACKTSGELIKHDSCIEFELAFSVIM